MTDQRSQRLIDAVADATRKGLGQVSSRQLDQGWQRLERVLDEDKGPSLPVVWPRSRGWLRGLAAAAAVLALGFGGYRLLAGRVAAPLHYAVEGARLGPEETLVVAASEPAKLVFSDRSEIHATPASKLRVGALDAHGARIHLADGELDVRVEHRQQTSWQFDAGPFSLKVRGTAFRLSFDAQRGRFAVQMTSGVVEVRGPAADRVFTLRAGESIELFANPERKPDLPAPVAPATTSEPAAAKPPVEPAPPRLPPARRRVAVIERGDSTPEAEPWTRLLARGEFAAVVKQAEARGLDTVLASASAADLTALADAARYTRRNDLARQALLAVRARFPGTTRASDAAFFLGRLAEVPAAGAGAALSWYGAYLSEAHDGPYAGEALGRQIVLWSRTDPARARQVARSYLERFPHGAQAELARSLVAAPAE